MAGLPGKRLAGVPLFVPAAHDRLDEISEEAQHGRGGDAQMAHARNSAHLQSGISFELAALVFEDERCLIYAERIDDKTAEQRWHAIRVARIEPGADAVLLAVHVYREDNCGEEIIRIISARAAEKHEIRRYQKQTLD